MAVLVTLGIRRSLGYEVLFLEYLLDLLCFSLAKSMSV